MSRPHRRTKERPRYITESSARCQRHAWREVWGYCTAPPRVRAYPTRALARSAMRVNAFKGMEPYRCDVCGMYHLGHYPAGVSRARRLLFASLEADRVAGRLSRKIADDLRAFTEKDPEE